MKEYNSNFNMQDCSANFSMQTAINHSWTYKLLSWTQS